MLGASPYSLRSPPIGIKSYPALAFLKAGSAYLAFLARIRLEGQTV